MSKVFKHNIVAIAVGLLVILLSVMPPSGLPKCKVYFADKIVHLVMYFALAASFFIGDIIQSKSLNIDYRRIAFVLIFCSLFGGLLELVQWFLPNRNTSIYDFLANIAGVLLAVIVNIVIYRIKKVKQNKF